jgi:hypothetical protein
VHVHFPQLSATGPGGLDFPAGTVVVLVYEGSGQKEIMAMDTFAITHLKL